MASSAIPGSKLYTGIGSVFWSQPPSKYRYEKMGFFIYEGDSNERKNNGPFNYGNEREDHTGKRKAGYGYSLLHSYGNKRVF